MSLVRTYTCDECGDTLTDKATLLATDDATKAKVASWRHVRLDWLFVPSKDIRVFDACSDACLRKILGRLPLAT